MRASPRTRAAWVRGVIRCGADLRVDGVGVALAILDAIMVLAVADGECGAVAGHSSRNVDNGASRGSKHSSNALNPV